LIAALAGTNLVGLTHSFPINLHRNFLILRLDFCTDNTINDKVTDAYNHLWDLIEKNTAQINGEVWSWKYTGSVFEPVPFSTYSSTESNAQQLWSLAFLGIKRVNE
jgi:hypothetical protein